MDIPNNIGRYQILGELGKGAMGTVYRAMDPNIGRTVALKTMRLDVHGTDEDEILKRFKHEAKLAGVLNHPNIVTIYDAGEFEGVFYMAMEFLEGETLQSLLHAQHSLQVDRVLEISRQACAGLDAAHSHGIIHRDIKPANIMITRDNLVKIMDFGIAKAGTNLTTTGQVLGTPSYMSPEQVRGKPLDGRSDLFSWGVSLYEMVVGEKPFTGHSVTTIIYKVINEDPIPPRDLDVTIHPGVSKIIMKALAKSPDERYQSGAELVQALQGYKSAVDASDSGQESASATTASMRAVREAKVPGREVETQDVVPGLGAQQSAEPPIISPLAGENTVGIGIRIGNKPLKSEEQAPAAKKPAMKLWVTTGVIVLLAAIAIYATMGRQKGPSPAEPVAQNPAAVTAPATDPGSTSGTGNSTPITSRVKGVIKLSSTPEGANVVLSGATPSTGTTPFTSAELVPGDYEIKVAKSGYQTLTRTVTVTAGNSLNLVAELAPTATARLTVNSTPPGADIMLDGKTTGKVTPAQFMLSNGDHKIALRKAGFRDVDNTTHMNTGENHTFAPVLEAAKSEGKNPFKAIRGLFGSSDKIPEGKGMLNLSSKPPGADAFHDGTKIAKETPMKWPMDPGNYSITLRLEGYKPTVRKFTIEKGKTTDLDVVLERK